MPARAVRPIPHPEEWTYTQSIQQAEENEEPTDEQSFTTGSLNSDILGCTMK